MILTLMAAEAVKTNAVLELIKVAMPGIVAALTTLLMLFLNRRYSKKDTAAETKKDAYTSNLDQLSKQREFIIRENEELWTALRVELDHCRVEREKLDATLELLKRKIARIENEIAAWELGLKTPAGFRLIKIEETGNLDQRIKKDPEK